MTQHIVLMTVVPPLIVLGRPWPRMWLPFPLAARRAVGGALSRSPSFRRSAGFFVRPWVALAVQSAMVALWHADPTSAHAQALEDLYVQLVLGGLKALAATSAVAPTR